MKRLILVAALFVLGAWQSFAQYPIYTVRQLQEEPQDSLVLADSIQGVTSRWTLQASPHIRHVSPFSGDTVTVVGLCVVPGKVLTFTNKGYTMLLYDTAAGAYPWGGIFVRCSADTATHIADGFLNVTSGNVIAMTGVLSEFPTNSFNSATQMQPIPGIPITILETGRAIPQYPLLTVDQFWNNSRVKYSTGEQYEGLIVQMTNLIVTTKENLTRGTFNMVDSAGNQITEYDASRYFTLKGTSIDHPYPDSVWTIRYAQLGNGTRVDSIRGYITTVSGSNNSRGYQIAPIYRGDIVFGRVPLLVSTHRRNPVVVTPDSAARISVVVHRQTGGFPPQSVSLFYSANNSGWNTLPMTLSDTTFKATIPQQPNGTFVKYFIKAIDSLGTSSIYASSASGSAGSDTGRGFFFYTSLPLPLSIHEIQYTPFLNGRSGYIGATNVAVSGTVTADTANIGRFPLGTGGTNSWYMQTGNQPWNGIWFDDTSRAAAYAVRNGDSVTVTGNITENFDVTQIYPFTAPIVVHASNVSVAPPVPLTTGTFGPAVGNGVPAAEQWEGMLVRFNNVTVTDTTQWTFSDPTEYAVDDGSGPILVRRDGVNTFTNQFGDTVGGRRLLRPGYRISYIQGVMYFSFNRYKLVPRTNADFGIVTGVDISRPHSSCITESAVRLSQGDFSTSIPPGGPAEVGALARTMEDMRRNLVDLTGTLRRRDAEARAVLSGVVEGVFAVDRNRIIRYLNPQAARLLNVNAEDAVGRFCGDVLKPCNEDGKRLCDFSCPILQARAGGSAKAIERLQVDERGVRTTVITSSEIAEGLQVQVIRDETELEAVRRARDTVLANISHEFRTPLAAQLASIELLREGLDTMGGGERKELVLSLERGTLRLTQLIDNLLESVRIEAGQLAIRRQSVELAQVIEDTRALIGSLLVQRNQTLEVSLPEDLPLVDGDVQRLTQVYVNLIANASKFAPESSTIRVGAVAEGDHVTTWVEDEGPGMPEGAGNSIFEQFRRGPDVEPEPGGLGLGLWIVKSIVDRHGGQIAAVRTAEGRTRFNVTLPAEKAE